MSEHNKPSEQRRRKEDQSANTTEFSRIITDPVTGKCYCRGKVLGKVRVHIARVIVAEIFLLRFVFFLFALHCVHACSVCHREGLRNATS